MIRYALVVAFITSLTGCAGGQTVAIRSGYSLTDKIGDLKTIHKGYPDALIHPPLEVDKTLLLQMGTRSLSVVSPRMGASTGPFEIDLWASARRDGLRIDTSSFRFVVDESGETFHPIVLFTSARAQVPMKGGILRLVCDFRDYIGGTSEVTGTIAVPDWGDQAWPTVNYDESVLCLRLMFSESPERFPPEANYTLRFSYLNEVGERDVAVHFFPVKYTYFRR